MNNNNNDNNIEAWMVQGIILIIVGSVFSGVCVRFLVDITDTSMPRVVIIPFLICGLAVLIKGTVSLSQGLNIKKGMKDESISAESVFDKHEKLKITDKIFSKLYVVAFLIFWFGFLIAFDYFAIKQGQMSMLAVSLIFWIAGIYIAIKKLKE
mgnify:CR=1 FL=1